MKRIILFLNICFMFIACEKNEYQDDKVLSPSNIQSRSIPSVIPYIIDQLYDIPVHVFLPGGVGGNEKTYLGASGQDVILYTSDDGSGRQRWYLDSFSTSGGVSRWNIRCSGGFSGDRKYISPDLTFPYMSNDNIHTSRFSLNYDGWKIEKRDNRFVIGSYKPQRSNTYWMKGKAFGNRDIELVTTEPTISLGKWNIETVDPMTLEEIEYQLLPDMSEAPYYIEHIRTIELTNPFPTDATLTFTFSETITDESEFSEAKGIDITNSITGSLKFSVPKVVEGGISVQQTTRETYSYSVKRKETSNFSFSYQVQQLVPSGKTHKAVLTGKRYLPKAAYIGRFYSETADKSVYMDGTWEGTQMYELKIDLLDASTDQQLRSISIPNEEWKED